MNKDNLATKKINKLVRSSTIDADIDQQYLLLPDNVEINILKNGFVNTSGLGKLDKKEKDLLNIINIKNALKVEYEITNIISPRTYVESLSEIPTHITVQGILITKMTESTRNSIKEMNNEYSYGKTEYDSLWVDDKSIDEIHNGEYLIIMNRRIGGWDGSLDKPVIELLGAGGHVPCVWNNERRMFSSLKNEEAIVKEAEEELGLKLLDQQIKKVGGFYNKLTSELVILYAIFINGNSLKNIQKNAFGNLEENIDGIYIGELENIIKKYNSNAESFAGGNEAKKYNFPSQSVLMRELFSRLGY